MRMVGHIQKICGYKPYIQPEWEEENFWELLDSNIKQGRIQLHITCPVCGNTYEVESTINNFRHYFIEGAHAQNAFPDLDKDKRELIISGVCNDCWNKMWPDEED